MYQDLLFSSLLLFFKQQTFYLVVVYLLLRSVPHKNVLFYFKSFRFVASLVALYHSIVKLLAVKLFSSSDLLYFLQEAD